MAPPSRAGIACAGEDDCIDPGSRLCKYADQSGLRTAAEEKARVLIEKDCALRDFINLDTCDTDVPGVQDCVVANGRDTGIAIADAIFPEGVGHTPCVPGPQCPPTPSPTPAP